METFNILGNLGVYYILDIICYEQFSLFAVSGHFCAAIMAPFFNDTFLCKIIICCCKVLLLTGDIEYSDTLTPVNAIQCTVSVLQPVLSSSIGD